MTRSILLPVSILFFSQILIAQTQSSKYTYQKFSADTLKSTINEITRELSVKHPGFYRYNSKDEFDKFIDSIKSTIKDSMSEMESFLKMKQIVSNIHCLHSGISLSKEYIDFLNHQPSLFPFQVYFNSNKAYIIKNCSADTSIHPGDEIISINGRTIDQITFQLLSLIPSDGYNLSMKYRTSYLQFPGWYRYIDLSTNFTTVIKQSNVAKTYQIRGARFDDIVKDGFLREPKRTKQLEFKIEDNTGFLTVHSFAQTDIKKAQQDFKEFIDQAFIELQTKKFKAWSWI